MTHDCHPLVRMFSLKKESLGLGAKVVHFPCSSVECPGTKNKGQQPLQFKEVSQNPKHMFLNFPIKHQIRLFYNHTSWIMSMSVFREKGNQKPPSHSDKATCIYQGSNTGHNPHKWFSNRTVKLRCFSDFRLINTICKYDDITLATSFSSL